MEYWPAHPDSSSFLLDCDTQFAPVRRLCAIGGRMSTRLGRLADWPTLPFVPLGRLAAWPLGRLVAWSLGRLVVWPIDNLSLAHLNAICQ